MATGADKLTLEVDVTGEVDDDEMRREPGPPALAGDIRRERERIDALLESFDEAAQDRETEGILDGVSGMTGGTIGGGSMASRAIGVVFAFNQIIEAAGTLYGWFQRMATAADEATTSLSQQFGLSGVGGAMALQRAEILERRQEISTQLEGLLTPLIEAQTRLRVAEMEREAAWADLTDEVRRGMLDAWATFQEQAANLFTRLAEGLGLADRDEETARVQMMLQRLNAARGEAAIRDTLRGIANDMEAALGASELGIGGFPRGAAPEGQDEPEGPAARRAAGRRAAQAGRAGRRGADALNDIGLRLRGLGLGVGGAILADELLGGGDQ